MAINIGDLVERLVSTGISISEAGEIIAAAFAAGVASSASQKSVSALRQQRYRNRKIGVTNRNESVTTLRPELGRDPVTKRNESVTNRNVVTSLSLSIEKEPKKERKKEREVKHKPRYALQIDFKLTDAMRQLALGRGVPAEKIPKDFDRFCDYHRSKGTLSADWMASWGTWTSRSVEYGQQNLVTREVSTYVDGRL